LPQDGIILGADTRATEGPIVADKNCEKIHYMAPNIYCCGAGTAADTEAVTGIFNNAYILLHIFISFLWLDFRFHLVHIVKPLKLRFLFIADMVSSQLQLHRYHTGRESRVVTALTLLKRHLFKLSFRTSVLSDFAPCIDHRF
jgi:20S proteasome subunit beta 2